MLKRGEKSIETEEKGKTYRIDKPFSKHDSFWFSNQIRLIIIFISLGSFSKHDSFINHVSKLVW